MCFVACNGLNVKLLVFGPSGALADAAAEVTLLWRY